MVYWLDRSWAWKPTWFKSLRAVKSLATRRGDVYRVESGVLIVSSADGTVRRYQEGRATPAADAAKEGRVRDGE
jgi:hypothetical protein